MSYVLFLVCSVPDIGLYCSLWFRQISTLLWFLSQYLHGLLLPPPLDLYSKVPYSMRLSLAIILLEIANLTSFFLPNTLHIPSWLEFLLIVWHQLSLMCLTYLFVYCLCPMSLILVPDKDVSFMKVGFFSLSVFFTVVALELKRQLS